MVARQENLRLSVIILRFHSSYVDRLLPNHGGGTLPINLTGLVNSVRPTILVGKWILGLESGLLFCSRWFPFYEPASQSVHRTIKRLGFGSLLDIFDPFFFLILF
jgi:hypothetical protein